MRHDFIILVDSPGALVEVCGISLLDRLLRTLQRLGVTKAIVLSSTPELIAPHLAEPSPHRAKVAIDLRPRDSDLRFPPQTEDVLPNDARQFVVVRGDCLFDSRLLQLLDDRDGPAALVDSTPPPRLQTLVIDVCSTKRGRFCGAALLSWDSLQSYGDSIDQGVSEGIESGEIEAVDIADRDWYQISMRRQLRPLWFSAPDPERQKDAERLLIEASQKGCLDLPALVHGPIENFLISYLCRTLVTPNQLTLVTNIAAWGATCLFALGHFGWGTFLALAVGILDGLDGKQARVKVETSKIGKFEHGFDALFEYSWWVAIGFYLQTSGWFSGALAYLFLLVGGEALAVLTRVGVLGACGRTLEELGQFNRLVRLIGGRRNIYVWIFAVGVAVGKPFEAYKLMAIWAMVTAVVQLPSAFISIRAHRERILPSDLAVEA